MASLSKIRPEYPDVDHGSPETPAYTDFPQHSAPLKSIPVLLQRIMDFIPWLVLLCISMAFWLGLYLIIS